MLTTIAHEYAVAPVLGPGAALAWHELAIESGRLADIVRRHVRVSYTAIAEPYESAAEMLADIDAGHIFVSTANEEHPLWTPAQNRDFRLVHDVLGHWVSGSDFTWEGEVRAYEAHLNRVVGVRARHALFTEAVGQVAFALTNGGQFGPQKCHLLSQWLQWAPLTDDRALATVAA